MKVFFGPQDVQLVLGFSMRAMRDLEIVLPHRNWTVTVSNYKGSFWSGIWGARGESKSEMAEFVGIPECCLS
jgi:hypothetical protein